MSPGVGVAAAALGRWQRCSSGGCWSVREGGGADGVRAEAVRRGGGDGVRV